jgi:uncharacterized protein (DUF433 family)
MSTSTDHLIEENPRRPGPARARLRESGVDVWVLVAQLPAYDGDVSALAASYDISEDEVRAAFAYYERHKALIDAYIAINAA